LHARTPIVFGMESAGARRPFLRRGKAEIEKFRVVLFVVERLLGGCAKQAADNLRSGKESWGDGVW
jgi:hypothetical protein